MKIKFLSSLALAAMTLGMASCASDEAAPVGGDSTVTLSVTLPDGIQSRTFGDGKTATTLKVLVYDVADANKTPLAVFPGGATELDTDILLSKQVNLQLVNGKTYKVVCWAQNAAAPYSFDPATYTVQVHFEGATTSDETLDAFYAAQDITVTGNTNETVKLYRPFAQVNIGTDDLAAAKAAGFTAKTVSVTAPTYGSLDLLTGKVEEGDPVTYTFGEGAIPTGETFPKPGYEYLSMNYILMPANKETVDMEFTVYSEEGAERTLPLSNVPVQRNYRTNIFGSLLTNSVSVKFEIEPAFEVPDYEHSAVFDLLMASLNAGKSTMLTENLSVPAVMAVTMPAGSQATLDLNGKALYNANDLWDESINAWSLLSLRQGTLTLKGNGGIIAKENDVYAADVQNGGHLIIEDGVYVGNFHCIYVHDGIAEIKGGTFDIQQKNPAPNEYNFLLNCLDANYKNGTAKIIVTGGTFIGFNPADNAAEGAHTNFVADGYKSVKTTVEGKDAWMVVPANTYVANDAASFKNVVDEINIAGYGTYDIILTNDVEWATGHAGDTSNMCFNNVGSKINIDLNGYKFIATGSGGFRNAATLNFSDGTIVDQTAYLYENGETAWEFTYLEFEQGVYNFDNVVFNNGVMFTNPKSTATNCTFKGIATLESNQNQEYCLWIYQGEVSLKNCKFSNGYRGVKAHDGYSTTPIYLTIDNCEFYDLSKKPGVCVDKEVKSCVIKNCTFRNVQPGEQNNYIYELGGNNPVTPTVENCTVL